MHYDLLNNEDIYILEHQRIVRFRTLFLEITGKSQESAILNLTLDNSLVINCIQSLGVLIVNLEEIGITAQYVLGISKIEIYYGTQLVCSKNILEEISNKETMTVAVENNTVELKSEQFNLPKITKSLALADIAADLDASPEDIHSFLMEHDGALIDFKGMIIVPESTAAIAYEHYSLVLARQKMQERFAPTPQLRNKDQGEKINATTKTRGRPSKGTSKKPSLTESGGRKNSTRHLVFKREFKANKKNYKRTIENFLQAMFPDAEEEKSLALFSIVEQSEIGRAYLDKILRAVDYPDKQHARNLLYKAAAELSKKNDGESERNPKEETERHFSDERFGEE